MTPKSKNAKNQQAQKAANNANLGVATNRLLVGVDKLTDSMDRFEKMLINVGKTADATAEKTKKAFSTDAAAQYLDIRREIKEIEDDIKSLTSKQGDRYKEIVEAAGDNKKLLRDTLKVVKEQSVQQVKLLKTKQSELEITDKIKAKNKELLEIEAQKEAKIKTQLGFLDNIGASLSRLPVIGNAFGAAFDATNLKAKLTKNIMQNIGSGAKGVSVLFKGIGPILKGAASAMTAFLAPLAPFLLIAGALYALKKWVDKARELDAAYTNVSNNLGVTKEYATGITKELVSSNVLLKEVEEFSAAIAGTFGDYSVSLMDSARTLHSFTFDLQVSSEQAVSMLKSSELLGESLESLWASTVNVTREYYEQNGLLLKEDILVNEARNNLLAISKINSVNLALYGKSNNQLVSSIQNMRRLGMEFDQVAKTAESVLDFESSIEKEMKTNVLLGKSINLNMVRYESLFGNAEGVAREMNKILTAQNINLKTFNGMLPFQKRALSDTFGMQADEMQLMLLKNKLADKALINLVEANKISAKDLATRGKITEEEANQLLYSQNRASIDARLAMVQQQVFDKLNNTLDLLAPLLDKKLKKAGLDPESLAKKEKRSNVVRDMGGFSGIGSIADHIEPKNVQQDFIWREGSGVQSFSKGDLVMGIDEGSLSRFSASDRTSESSSTTSSTKLLEENNRLMAELIKKVDQPVQFNVNGRVIDEIDSQVALRKSYNVTDQSYGTFAKK